MYRGECGYGMWRKMTSGRLYLLGWAIVALGWALGSSSLALGRATLGASTPATTTLATTTLRTTSTTTATATRLGAEAALTSHLLLGAAGRRAGHGVEAAGAVELGEHATVTAAQRHRRGVTAQRERAHKKNCGRVGHHHMRQVFFAGRGQPVPF